MAILSILTIPDPRLYTVAKPVESFDQRLVQLSQDMLETMYDASGIGLAATQIDVHERLLVLDVSEERNNPMVFVNPELVWVSEEITVGSEGCLSVPDVYDNVPRHSQIRVAAHDAHGKPFELEADGLLAVCIQHEMDHLLGKVFIEYLSPLKQGRIETKLRKAQRENAKSNATQ